MFGGFFDLSEFAVSFGEQGVNRRVFANLGRQRVEFEQRFRVTTVVEQQLGAGAQKKRLSYMEAREWESIEQRIHDSEQELAARHAELQNPEVTRDPERMKQAYERARDTQAMVDQLYERWAELEAKQV
jgi:ABC transporter C-terminal domain